MSQHASPVTISRRRLLGATLAAASAAMVGGGGRSHAAGPVLTVASRTIEVDKKAAKVFGISGAGGRHGIFAAEGDRLSGALLNATADPLQMHWHGQIKAPFDQDRARPNGGMLAPGQSDQHEFELTPGTHWMHSHTLSEQRLLAAPMIAREKDAGDAQDVVVMLHDFAFRSPEEILAELGGSAMHGTHATPAPTTPAHQGHNMHAGHRMGMVHANDVAYDAFLANDRTLADPEVMAVEKGGRVRLRIINGGTATAFLVTTPGLRSQCIAVDGTPCEPVAAAEYPLAQGQRIDLALELPRDGGAFPILAQVEDMTAVTGIVLATAGAAISKVAPAAARPAGMLDLAFEGRLKALRPLALKRPDRSFTVLLGEEPGYRWTINGRVHGEHQPFDVRQGERVEMTFMNPTSMMHPMHLHGHHFQVVGIGGQRFAGPMRDTVIVPAQVPVTIAFDAGLKGAWFLHCHHLYHMATGMMTEVRIG